MFTLERNSLRLAAATLLMAMAPAAAAQPYEALPIDEAHEVPSFAAWRDSLAEAVDRRDTEAVVAMAAPDIRLSFGDDSGPQTLRVWLNGIDGEPWTGEAYWQELEKLLALGGVWQDWGDDARHFCAPYTFSAELPPELEENVFDAVIVVQPDAPLRRAPDSREQPVATLNNDILQIVESRFDPENPLEPYWMSVRTSDGTHEGWIESTVVRSPVDYRACFTEADDGRWRWDLFVAGD